MYLRNIVVILRLNVPKFRDQYVSFPDNQYGMTAADPLGYEHLLVLFVVIAVGIGWSAIFALCELGGSRWRRRGLPVKDKSGEISKKRRASF